MSGEFTLDDLAEESGASAASSASGGEDTGEWLNDLYDKLSDDGIIDKLVTNYMGEQREMSEIQADKKGQTTAAEENAEAAAEAATEIDADVVKDVLLELYDAADNLPMVSDDPTVSEIIKLIDANPDMADSLIQEHL